MTERRPLLGIDIGGTNLSVAVATADGAVLSMIREPSRTAEGPDVMIGRLIGMARAVAADADVEMEDIEGIGVVCGGPLDPERGVVLNALNNPGWVGIPLVDILLTALGRPTFLENDANAATLGEHRFGAGRGVANLVYLTVSTGVGGGAIVDGRLIHGEQGNAAELGHIVVQAGGRPCHCGSRGCLEAYCSGTNIAARARELVDSSTLPSTLRSLERPLIRAEDVVAAARAGDTLAARIWDETVQMLGAGLVSVIRAFNPRLILLGGGVTNAGDLLFEPVRRIVADRAVPYLGEAIDVVPGHLGSRSGVLGAVAVAVDHLRAGGPHARSIDRSGSARGADPEPGGPDGIPDAFAEHARVAAQSDALAPLVRLIAERLCEALEAGGKLVTFGNGGSAAEAQHFAGELVGRFRVSRRPLPAIALTGDVSTLTCVANDFGYDEVFARQAEALVAPGDLVVGISTSGRSESVVRGLRAARRRGAVCVAWTGADPGPAGEAADLVLAVPSTSTARIQEIHTLVMHAICGIVDVRMTAGATLGGIDPKR